MTLTLVDSHHLSILISISFVPKLKSPPPHTPHTQGMMMGWLTASGSLARTLGPIFVSFLYHHLGPLITFSTVDGIIAASILLLLVSRHRLIPYKLPPSFSATL